jgi:Spy/CpxP family protein refolding chaperone
MMKKFNFFSLIFMGLLMFFSPSAVKAQDEMPPPPDFPNKQVDRGERRPNLLAELGLSQQQRQQIRQINAEKKSIVRDAQQRLRDANRNLDQSIYADNVNETEVQARLKEVQTAQAELIKIRFNNELAVRKILTAGQLAKFRGLRQQFAQRIEDGADKPPKNPMRNLKQNLKLRGRQARPND